MAPLNYWGTFCGLIEANCAVLMGEADGRGGRDQNASVDTLNDYDQITTTRISMSLEKRTGLHSARRELLFGCISWL
jgi:hypothetical protein